jgi:hypothetical protein
MSQVIIRVRDVTREAVHQLSPQEPALRGPYELFNPVGAVRRHADLAEYLQGGLLRTGRIVETKLGETKPGERVLVRLPPKASDDEWWLCEVEAIDGVAATQ